jgi:hypothetical protein
MKTTAALFLKPLFFGIAFQFGALTSYAEQIKTPRQFISNPETNKKFSTKHGQNLSFFPISSSKIQAKKPPRFLIQGGLHGNELLTSEFVMWLAARFESGVSQLNKISNIEIDFIPYANPDGTLFYSRSNANGINLNRNFGMLWGITKENPGPKAFSETESKAIKQLFEKREYLAAIDVHGYVNWIVAPSSPKFLKSRGIKTSKAKEQEYDLWTNSILERMKDILPNYELKSAGELGDGGAFEDWAFWNANVMAACLEMHSANRFSFETFQRVISKVLTSSIQPDDGRRDDFIVYEKFIRDIFNEALKIRSVSVELARQSKDQSANTP